MTSFAEQTALSWTTLGSSTKNNCTLTTLVKTCNRGKVRDRKAVLRYTNLRASPSQLVKYEFGKMGTIPQITQIAHNDILVKEIKSAHDHLRCKYDNFNNEKTQKKKLSHSFSLTMNGVELVDRTKGRFPSFPETPFTSRHVQSCLVAISRCRATSTVLQARNQGGARGAFAPPHRPQRFAF